ncbi:MAG: hypothetical protein V4527_14840 [Pseudomonadota bacterium]
MDLPQKAKSGSSRAWRGQAFICGLLALLLVGIAGAIVHSCLLSVVGFFPLGAFMLWLRFRDNQRAALDLEFAAQREKDRVEIRSKVEASENQAAPARERQFWYGVVGIPFVGLLLIVLHRTGPFASWENQEAILLGGIFVISITLSIVLISLVRWFRSFNSG